VTSSSHRSVSSWSQPTPPPASTKRTELISEVADRINALGPDRLRIAVDGRTAVGKTSFGHELAAALNALGRPTLRACFDDFKNPWSEAHLYDRLSGEGYYRNAYDFPAAVSLLLRPAGPDGDGRVTLCSRDPLTGGLHQGTTVQATDDAILIVDSAFAFRSEYNDYWDYRIYLDVDAELSIARGILRDSELEGADEAENLHRNRYGVAERVYRTEVNPEALADVVVDNTDFADPHASFIDGAPGG
jgi:uridine kinase